MVFIAAVLLFGLSGAPPGDPQQDQDVLPVARRLAATTQLAAQEYGLGVRNGAVVSPEELSEAKLFLTEARRTAGFLPLALSRSVTAQVDSLTSLMDRRAEPDSVTARVTRLGESLATALGTTLEVLPEGNPSLARGAQVYQANCAGCHGITGRGDGPLATGLTPPPANLSDPVVLRSRSPLDFYHRISIGVAGTSMPAYEGRLSEEDRWAAAAYSTVLRLPVARGEVPAALRAFPTTARMSDAEVLAAIAPEAVTAGDSAARLAAVRSYQEPEAGTRADAAVFAQVRQQLDSAMALARAGQFPAASATAFDAYMTFERVERAVRARNPGLASDLEAGFAAFRTRAAGGATPAELSLLRERLGGGLENAERVIADRMSGPNLFLQSFVIMVREGLEAILIIGALLAFLTKTGAGARRRDIHIGVGAAIGTSLLTAVLLETLFQIAPSRREGLEGGTMLVAMVMLFYVSYWLLSKMEVAKWNRFVKGKVQDALSSGSALALVSVAFLAVYREGFETMLFYKALFVAAGAGAGVLPVVGGIVAGGIVLVAAYLAINRYGVRLPLKPFFGVTSAFLYYMAFVFAGKGIAELQEGGLVGTTIIPWAPRVPALGIYPTLESLALQGVLLLLFVIALVWTFVIEPRRLAVTPVLVPEAGGGPVPSRRAGDPVPPLDGETDLLRSLERMDADLAEMRAEIERIKRKLGAERR
jgi:high-affinity iron transporter